MDKPKYNSEGEDFKDFLDIDWQSFDKIPIIAIYKNPADYPDKYVARVWDADKPKNIFVLRNSLEEIRKIIPRNFIRIDRHPSDDPCIVECWL